MVSDSESDKNSDRKVSKNILETIRKKIKTKKIKVSSASQTHAETYDTVDSMSSLNSNSLVYDTIGSTQVRSRRIRRREKPFHFWH